MARGPRPPSRWVRRDIPRVDTAVLLIQFDFVTLVAIALTTFGAVGGGPINVGDLDVVVFVGGGLIVFRTVLLAHMVGFLRIAARFLIRILPFVRDSNDNRFIERSRQSRSRNNGFWEAIGTMSDEERARGVQRVDDSRALFQVLIAMGTVGLAMIVMVTGGPFGSPFAVILVSVFSLGQVRAPTVLGLWSLFLMSIALFIGLDWLRVALTNNSDYYRLHNAPPSQSPLLAFILIAFVTSYVNRATLFERVPAAQVDASVAGTPAAPTETA